MSNVRLTIDFFWKYTKRYPKDLVLGLMNSIQTIINGVAIPYFLGFAAAKLSDPNAISLSFSQILPLIAALSVVGIAVNRMSLAAINRYEIKATKDIAGDIAAHILGESYDFHTKNFSGALINKATKLANSYIVFVDTLAMDTLRNVILIVFSITLLTFYSPTLALIIAVVTFFGIYSTVYMTRKYYPLQKKTVKLSSLQTAYLSDIITNAITVKTFAAEKFEEEHYKQTTSRFGKAQLEAWMKQLDANGLRMVAFMAMNLSVLSYGIYATSNNILSVGLFITAQMYAMRISFSFWDASGIVRNLERAFADAHEMIEILNTPHTLVDAPQAPDLEVTKGEVVFDSVTFHYQDSPADKPIFENFSLVLKPGEKVGLVGKSGGGKTTVTKLALRFMDIQKGSIKVDGQDISGVTQSSLRSAIAYVPQEPLLFHRSLSENIRYGKQNASQKEIEAAAKLAHAHDFIKALPQGYDTKVGERGIKLSGGQRQRVAIARAILCNAPILVLDEATSALDSESEKLIQDALRKLMERKTALVIAHRLSTVQKMDRIIVVDNGKIIEQGTHQELLKNKGTYSELWNHQSGGFLED